MESSKQKRLEKFSKGDYAMIKEEWWQWGVNWKYSNMNEKSVVIRTANAVDGLKKIVEHFIHLIEDAMSFCSMVMVFTQIS